MGQRLVITVNEFGKDIVKIYYHWSAYSVSALCEAREIINVLYDDDNEEKDLRLRLIRFVENNGGGIDGGEGSDEWKRIAEMYPNEVFKKENISRNNGLIALSEEGMDDVQDWSEGDVYINLDENEIINYVNFSYESINEYNENRSEWDDDFESLTLEDLPKINYNLSNFSVFDINDVIEELNTLNGYVCRDKENNICELIA